MRTFIVLVLDTRSQKADGTYPVKMRVVHYEKSTAFSLGIHLKKQDWDEKARCIKPSYRGTDSVVRLNNYLMKQKTEAVDLITRLDERNILDGLTVVQIKDLILGKSDLDSFFKYAEEIVAAMRKAGKIGNARTYEFTISVLRGYVKRKDLTFREITYDFLKKFETEHLAKGNGPNSLATYMRTVRAIYNKAILSGRTGGDGYPFSAYQIRTKKSSKRAISSDAIKRVIELSFDRGHKFFHARNYFLLSYYLMGMSFVDMAHLRLANMVDGRMKFERQKTGAPTTSRYPAGPIYTGLLHRR